jgi:phosphoserine phosphatase
MTENTAVAEQFTGLILLTGNDKPGVAASLFETLAPFAVHVIEIEQIVINNRLILTVLIGASPAHQSAIEEDLNTCATALDVDIATLFGKSQLTPIAKNLVHVVISATKLHPQAVAHISKSITDCGGNIQSFARTSANPVSIKITVSGVSKDALSATIETITFEDSTTISVSEI